MSNLSIVHRPMPKKSRYLFMHVTAVLKIVPKLSKVFTTRETAGHAHNRNSIRPVLSRLLTQSSRLMDLDVHSCLSQFSMNWLGQIRRSNWGYADTLALEIVFNNLKRAAPRYRILQNIRECLPEHFMQ